MTLFAHDFDRIFPKRVLVAFFRLLPANTMIFIYVTLLFLVGIP